MSAYDVVTGALKWRFYTVLPDPEPIETRARHGRKTWVPHRNAQYKGGGTHGTASPTIRLSISSTSAPRMPLPTTPGNSGLEPGRALSPHRSSRYRPIRGTGLALPDHTPRSWDFDAVQKLVMADLTFAGRSRQTIMQASKNGFFYILDRKTGELLSAANYTYINWASGVDMKTGRPIPTAQATGTPDPRMSIRPGRAGTRGTRCPTVSPHTSCISR